MLILPKLGTSVVIKNEPEPKKNSPVKINGSGSGCHNVGPDFPQRYFVSLGGLDAEERRDDDCEKRQWKELLR